MDVFCLKKYKEIIILRSKERKQQFGQRFSLAKVAAACGIQKTYLSKVLNSDAHLSPDQLAAACEFLNCTEEETEFILLLRDQETATHRIRRKVIAARIDALLARVRKTSAVLEGAKGITDPEMGWLYYTDVYMQLVHLFLTIPAFRDNLDRIKAALGISKERLMEVIFQLERHGLASFDGQTYKSISFNFHLEPSSPIYRPYRALQRMKSLEKIDKLQGEDSCYALTAVFAADQNMYDAAKTRILKLIKEIQSSVISSNAENVFQLNIDFFRWDS